MIRTVALGLVLAVGVAACSQQQVYEAVQHNQQLECQKQPPSMYDECMAQVSQPYDQYAAERELANSSEAE